MTKTSSRVSFGRTPETLKYLGGCLVVCVMTVGEQDAVRQWHSPKETWQQFAVSFHTADENKTEHQWIVKTSVGRKGDLSATYFLYYSSSQVS